MVSDCPPSSWLASECRLGFGDPVLLDSVEIRPAHDGVLPAPSFGGCASHPGAGCASTVAVAVEDAATFGVP